MSRCPCGKAHTANRLPDALHLVGRDMWINGDVGLTVDTGRGRMAAVQGSWDPANRFPPVGVDVDRVVSGWIQRHRGHRIQHHRDHLVPEQVITLPGTSIHVACSFMRVGEEVVFLWTRLEWGVGTSVLIHGRTWAAGYVHDARATAEHFTLHQAHGEHPRFDIIRRNDSDERIHDESFRNERPWWLV